LDPKSPVSLYYIYVHYFSIKDYKHAFDYFKKGFKIGFPLEKQYSLKPTISFIHLPKLLIPLCYNFTDYDLGIEACELFIKNNPPDKSINDWYEIFINMKRLPPLKPPVVFDKKVICFVADGGYGEWDGSSLEKGIGGSEKYIIMMAKYMKKLTDCIILVFCKTPTIIECDGVKYIPLNNIYTSLTVHYIDICIISRFSQYLPVVMNGYTDKVYAVVHDVTLSGEVIIDSPKLKNIICLTEWHKNYFLEKHPEMKDKTIVIGNGIEEFVIKSHEKKPFKFIYTFFIGNNLLISSIISLSVIFIYLLFISV